MLGISGQAPEAALIHVVQATNVTLPIGWWEKFVIAHYVDCS